MKFLIHRSVTITLFEQASYSGGRFLFWVSAPVLVTSAWEELSILSLMNLLTMTLYSSVVGGPVFYRLVKRDEKDIRDSYLLSQVIIVGLALVGPALYVLFWWEAAFEDPFFIILLFLLPWVSTAADWAPYANIARKQFNQVLRNVSFAVIWMIYSAITFIVQAEPDLTQIT